MSNAACNESDYVFAPEERLGFPEPQEGRVRDHQLDRYVPMDWVSGAPSVPGDRERFAYVHALDAYNDLCQGVRGGSARIDAPTYEGLSRFSTRGELFNDLYGKYAAFYDGIAEREREGSRMAETAERKEAERKYLVHVREQEALRQEREEQRRIEAKREHRRELAKSAWEITKKTAVFTAKALGIMFLVAIGVGLLVGIVGVAILSSSDDRRR